MCLRTQKSWLVAVTALPFLMAAEPAQAVPSFAIQTSQPCAVCHVGAFGPQLKPAGRDFKLYGYVNGGGKEQGLPLTFGAMGGFTNTATPRGGRADQSFDLPTLSAYYAGRVTSRIGAFVSLAFNPTTRQGGLGRADVRTTHEVRLFDRDLLLGVAVNNNPTISDVWNSTPAWGFPFARPPYASRPKASVLIEGRLRQRVVGANGYLVWNNFLYAEGGAYTGLDDEILKAIGITPAASGDHVRGAAPYGRLSLFQDIDRHYVQVGAYGLSASVAPRGANTFGRADRFANLGLDANYQFILDPGKAASDVFSANATLMRETGNLEASQALTGALRQHRLQTLRINASYSFAATFTSSVQYFRTTGSSNARYWGAGVVRPDTEGMIYELSYVPWGKPGSPAPIQGLNAKLFAQYTDYFRFDGSRLNAARKNAFLLGLTTFLGF